MKKIVLCILTIMCFIFFSGCNSKFSSDKNSTSTTTSVTPETLALQDVDMIGENKFSEYLDDVQFIPGISQISLFKQAEKYSYNNTKITDIVGELFYDGESGGGCKAIAELFGFANDYTVTDDNYGNAYNELYTQVPLDGLEMPYNISFEDNIETVLQKLETTIDLQKNFVLDKNSEDAMTLLRNSTSSLKLIDYNLSNDKPTENSFSYQIEYTESYTEPMENENSDLVTRKVIMSFSNDDNTLCLFKISINEKWKLDK